MSEHGPVDEELLREWRARSAPPDLAARIAARVDQDEVRRPVLPRFAVPALTAALASLLVVVGLRLQNGGEPLPGEGREWRGAGVPAVGVPIAGPPLKVPGLSRLKPMPSPSARGNVRLGTLPTMFDMPRGGFSLERGPEQEPQREEKT